FSDDVSLVVVLVDINPFFWSTSPSLSLHQFLSHVLAFLNSVVLLNQLNQIRLEEFVSKDENLGKQEDSPEKRTSSLLSGSLSMALCYIQRVFRSGPLHPQPRGSPDGSEQYVSVMNAIFSAQRSMVPIDCCYVGSHNSAFLQQASYITGGVYVKPQHLDGLFQYLVTVFAVDLHSRDFLQLPRPAGVDFRASCFCHKTTIDMGYVCSVCLSIFCKRHQKCSTCGSEFPKAQQDASTESDRKRKAPEA
ncbi:General transcription and DNA repair factor IIH subunit TFB4, partial [Linum perenne]